MKRKNFLKWIILGILILVDVFIIVNAFINGKASAQESNKVAHIAADAVNTIKPETITETNFPKFAFNIRKLIGHFSLFGLSGILTMWTANLFYKTTNKLTNFVFVILILVKGFSLAVVSEFIQKFISDRTGSWKDIGIDFSGYFIGVLLVILIILLINLILKKRVNKTKN